MALNFDRLTIKAQEALQAAQRDAEERGHQQIEAEHLLHALLGQEGGVAWPLLEKVGADPGGISKSLAEALDHLPRVSGLTQTYLSPGLNHVFNTALSEAEVAERRICQR